MSDRKPYLCAEAEPWHPPIATPVWHPDAVQVRECDHECCVIWQCPWCHLEFREELPQ